MKLFYIGDTIDITIDIIVSVDTFGVTIGNTIDIIDLIDTIDISI